VGGQALQACLKNIGAALSDLRHLCCVTSTGYLTPGLGTMRTAVVNSLFGDGAAALALISDGPGEQQHGPGSSSTVRRSLGPGRGSSSSPVS
jgi:predicted naringenin-chalcone synthase